MIMTDRYAYYVSSVLNSWQIERQHQPYQATRLLAYTVYRRGADIINQSSPVKKALFCV